MKKIAIIVGTRPEAIKTAVLINKLQNEFKACFDYKLILTGQHDSMLYQVLSIFKIHENDMNQENTFSPGQKR